MKEMMRRIRDTMICYFLHLNPHLVTYQEDAGGWVCEKHGIVWKP